MNARDLTLEDIHVGDTDTFTRTWTEEDVVTFARLSGDTNPLHVDISYAKTTKFESRLVHGMLLGALFSQFVGMYIPGKRCLYLSQSLFFKKPVYIGDTVAVTGIVTSVSLSTRLIQISLSISKGEQKVVTGEAHVQIL
jgi:3-hydroxybutyryl-CoA dehydratase